MTPKYRSSKLALKKRRIRIWRISLAVVFVIVFIIGISFWSKHSSMEIMEIEVDELNYINEEELKKAVIEELNGSYLGILSRKNSLIFPRGKVEDKITEMYSSAKSVDADFRGFNKVKINLKEFEPKAKWCEDSECYLLNKDGYIFVKEPIINTYSFVTFRGNIEGDRLRNTFLDKSTFTAFLRATEILKEDLAIEITSIEEDEYPVFNFYSKSGAVFLIDREDDMRIVIENIKTVFDKEGINREQFENIDYIDLRFGNKVFYKLR